MLAIYRENFRVNLSDHFNPCRVYAYEDEAGLLVCSWPESSEEPAPPVPYLEEVWTGLEYMLASHLIARGLTEEGLTVVRAARERQPSQLSGGQSQCVAIGRAIVKEPKAFLFDEPLSNLDAELRVKMRSEISALHRRLGSTMIHVTHDQVEAMTMADTMVVLRDGAIKQIGSPIDLYSHPRNRFVVSFLGAPQMNLLAAAWVAEGDAASELILDEGRVRIPTRAESAGNAALLGIKGPSKSTSLTNAGRLLCVSLARWV